MVQPVKNIISSVKKPAECRFKVSSTFIIGDNGILVILFALGWIGTMPYIVGLISSIVQICRGAFKYKDLTMHAAYAIILGQILLVYFKSPFYGAFSMIMWGFAGIGMAGNRYYLARQKAWQIAQTNQEYNFSSRTSHQNSNI